MGVLITGGAGFVGLNLCEALLARGERVVAFDKGPVPQAARDEFAALPGHLTVVEGDVCDPRNVRDVFGATKVDRVIHGAAVTAGPEREFLTPTHTVETNVMGTMHVLEMAWRHGIGRIVHLSSGSVYGARGESAERLAEEDPQPLPESLYAVSKYAAERIARRYQNVKGQDIVIARLGAVFGPWEYPTEARETLSAPMLASCVALLGRSLRLSADGLRDWVYSRDVARGVLALLDAEDPRHAVYNIGSGQSWSMGQWCGLLAARLPGLDWAVAGPGEVPNVELYDATRRSPMEISRISAELGHVPQFGLEAAFADYLDWLEAHPFVYGK